MTGKRSALMIIGAAIALVVGITALCNLRVDHVAKGRIHIDPALIPAQNVAVVLGSTPARFFFARWYSARADAAAHSVFTNNYQAARVKAAAQLYHSGHARCFIVSGMPSQASEMKADLIAQGVPADKITCDSGGYRTLASMIRARDVFGQKSFTVISQPDHCARAIYLAESYGIDAVGFAAEDPRYYKDGRYSLFFSHRTRKVVLREFFARAKAVLDVHILYRHPTFPGGGTPIPDPIDPNGPGS
jgi:SanA protein